MEWIGLVCRYIVISAFLFSFNVLQAWARKAAEMCFGDAVIWIVQDGLDQFNVLWFLTQLGTTALAN